jgi:hypothetical protein
MSKPRGTSDSACSLMVVVNKSTLSRCSLSVRILLTVRSAIRIERVALWTCDVDRIAESYGTYFGATAGPKPGRYAPRVEVRGARMPATNISAVCCAIARLSSASFLSLFEENTMGPAIAR